MGRLDGKRAVVVGGGQSKGATIGFGRATSIRFAREGAAVAIVDRDRDSATETADMIHDEGGKAAVVVADIADAEACRRLPAEIRDHLGGIDVLFNGVGILGNNDPVTTDEALWDRVMDVNLRGMWLVCKYLIPLMIEQDTGGSIVNISSIGAIRGPAASYCVSKAGVNSLTRTLAECYAKYDIRANAVMPGVIDTPMAVDGYVAETGVDRDVYVKHRESRVPMRYKGTGWDVAALALFLASDESRYISGAEIPIDGALNLSTNPYPNASA